MPLQLLYFVCVCFFLCTLSEMMEIMMFDKPITI